MDGQEQCVALPLAPGVGPARCSFPAAPGPRRGPGAGVLSRIGVRCWLRPYRSPLPRLQLEVSFCSAGRYAWFLREFCRGPGGAAAPARCSWACAAPTWDVLQEKYCAVKAELFPGLAIEQLYGLAVIYGGTSDKMLRRSPCRL
jgi:hypothetical protein